MKLILTIILFMFTGPQAFGQLNWSKTSLPEIPFPSVAASPNGTIIAGSMDGKVFVSTNSGADWTSVSVPMAGSIQSINAVRERVFLISTKDRGIYKSTDSGTTFARATGTEKEYRDLIEKNGVYFAAPKDEGVMKSTDNGSTWVSTGYLTDQNIGAFAKTRSNNLLVGVKGGRGVYRSVDNGDTWVKTEFPQHVIVYSLTVSNENTIFAGTGEVFDGVYKSVDDGLTWTKIDGLSGTIQYKGNGIFLSNGDLLIGSNGTGIFHSSDEGETWNLNNEGLDNTFGFAFTQAPNGDVYATTGSGVFKADNLSTSLDESAEKADGFELYQNYPNPFNPSTTIHWNMNKPSYVTLSVYDTLGREIVSLASGYHGMGEYTAKFDASKLSSGIYFYRLSTGDQILQKSMMLIK